jgi:hypothetical protein
VAGCPAVAPGGRGPRALVLSFLVAGAVWWGSAGFEGLQAGDRGGDLGGPGPGRGDAQPQAAGRLRCDEVAAGGSPHPPELGHLR